MTLRFCAVRLVPNSCLFLVLTRPFIICLSLSDLLFSKRTFPRSELTTNILIGSSERFEFVLSINPNETQFQAFGML